MGRIIGIDLGTTNSAMAFMDGKEPRIIPNDRGNRITPSVVAFTDTGDVLVGESAKNQAIINASRTILAVKREMGRQKVYEVDEKAYSPQEISALILQKLKADAESFLGEEVNDAVITVPAHFSEKQRVATQEAGRLAGLRIRRIINEPTAAALAYAYRSNEHNRILVYDLGGGTFDVSCLLKEDSKFIVRSTAGNNNLGGIDFDELVLDIVLDHFENESGIEIRNDKILMQQLLEQVEQAKIELSSRESALIALPFIGGTGKPVHLSYQLQRTDFNKMIDPLLQQTIKLTMRAVKEAHFGIEGIDTLVFSGGSSRIPLVRTYVSRALNPEHAKQVNPDEIVALGAAVQASMITEVNDDISVKDVTSYNLGVEIEGDKFINILSRNTQLPAEIRKMFTTVSDNQSSVEIHVLQGDENKASANLSLGRFLLAGIREGKRGEARIEVVFQIDVDGIAHIKAHDIDTGSEQKITVNPVEDDTNGKKHPLMLKARVVSLQNRVASLFDNYKNSIDPPFRREIKDALKESKKAVERVDKEKLSECRIILETIIGELNAMYQETEAGLGNA